MKAEIINAMKVALKEAPANPFYCENDRVNEFYSASIFVLFSELNALDSLSDTKEDIKDWFNNLARILFNFELIFESETPEINPEFVDGISIKEDATGSMEFLCAMHQIHEIVNAGANVFDKAA